MKSDNSGAKFSLGKAHVTLLTSRDRLGPLYLFFFRPSILAEKIAPLLENPYGSASQSRSNPHLLYFSWPLFQVIDALLTGSNDRAWNDGGTEAYSTHWHTANSC